MYLLTIPYPEIDPVFFNLGPLPIRWYSLAYIAGITLGWFSVTRLMKMPQLWQTKLAGTAPVGPPISREMLDDLLFWVTLGVILGGRVGYVLFYETGLLFQPWISVQDIMGGTGLVQTLLGWIHIPPAFMIWNGGMSFHGGMLGVALAGYLFCRRNGLDHVRVGDLVSCVVPIGLFFGRIANFINGELYGRFSEAPWAMVFPADPLQIPRHPSQLYEAALEGIALFVAIRIAVHFYGVLTKRGFGTGMFLVGYGLSRIIVENFREPDLQMPDFPLGLTMGMFLSGPMMILGGLLIWQSLGGFSRSANANKASSK